MTLLKDTQGKGRAGWLLPALLVLSILGFSLLSGAVTLTVNFSLNRTDQGTEQRALDGQREGQGFMKENR